MTTLRTINHLIDGRLDFDLTTREAYLGESAQAGPEGPGVDGG